MKKIFTLISLTVFSLVGNSQVLGIYEFTGAQQCPVENPNVTTQPTGATFSAFSSAGVVCAPTSNVFNSQGWSTEFTDTSYYEFSVSADLGKVMNLDSIVFSTRISNSDFSVPTWHLRSNIDNFSADITTGFSTSTLDTVRYMFSSNFSDLSIVTFRLFVSGVDTDQRAFRVDNVSLIGEIVNQSSSSIKENGLDLFQIFPNPGSEKLIVSQKEIAKNTKISIFSAAGKLIASTLTSDLETTFYTHEMMSGIYFVEVKNENNSSTYRWIKE